MYGVGFRTFLTCVARHLEAKWKSNGKLKRKWRLYDFLGFRSFFWWHIGLRAFVLVVRQQGLESQMDEEIKKIKGQRSSWE